MEANYAGTYRRSMPDNQADLVTLERIRYAAEQIRGVAVRTPLLPWEDGVWLKPESLQPVGAFKMRGAYFRLSTLTDDERSAGVITYSSGNHAQAVARAARRRKPPAGARPDPNSKRVARAEAMRNSWVRPTI